MKITHPRNLVLVSFSRKFVGLKFYLSYFFVKTWIWRDTEFSKIEHDPTSLRHGLPWSNYDETLWIWFFSQLATIMGISTAKIQTVVSCDLLMSIIHFSSKLIKIAFLWRPIVAKRLNRFNFYVCFSTWNLILFHFSKSEIFRWTHGFRVISENLKRFQKFLCF